MPIIHVHDELAQLVSALAEPVFEAMRGTRAAITLADDELRYELKALRYSAVRLAVRVACGTDTAALQRLTEALDTRLGLVVVPGMKDREIAYVAATRIMRSNSAMFDLPPEATNLHFTENPLENVGLLFGHFCSARHDPLVPLVGATVFGRTYQDTITRVKG